MLNNAIVLALAHDFTGDAKYLNAVVEGMDYILGRNPLDQSYVTGYGERPLENPHHRFWAHQANAKFPPPPPGRRLGRPELRARRIPTSRPPGCPGCAPQKCFIDHIEAWSANEITINWNAPLAWVAAFLDEKASGAGKQSRPRRSIGAPQAAAALSPALSRKRERENERRGPLPPDCLPLAPRTGEGEGRGARPT